MEPKFRWFGSSGKNLFEGKATALESNAALLLRMIVGAVWPRSRVARFAARKNYQTHRVRKAWISAHQFAMAAADNGASPVLVEIRSKAWCGGHFGR
jgi:hypothetical protein